VDKGWNWSTVKRFLNKHAPLNPRKNSN